MRYGDETSIASLDVDQKNNLQRYYPTDFCIETVFVRLFSWIHFRLPTTLNIKILGSNILQIFKDDHVEQLTVLATTYANLKQSRWSWTITTYFQRFHKLLLVHEFLRYSRMTLIAVILREASDVSYFIKCNETFLFTQYYFPPDTLTTSVQAENLQTSFMRQLKWYCPPYKHVTPSELADK